MMVYRLPLLRLQSVRYTWSLFSCCFNPMADAPRVDSFLAVLVHHIYTWSLFSCCSNLRNTRGHSFHDVTVSPPYTPCHYLPPISIHMLMLVLPPCCCTTPRVPCYVSSRFSSPLVDTCVSCSLSVPPLQENVFSEVAPVVRSCLDGYNACILAYG